jgi:hypothetical protein
VTGHYTHFVTQISTLYITHIKQEEVLERTNLLLSLIRHGTH